MRIFLILLSISSVLLLSACTGGQGTDNTTPNPPTLSLNLNGQDVTKSTVDKTGLVEFQLSNNTTSQVSVNNVSLKSPDNKNQNETDIINYSLTDCQGKSLDKGNICTIAIEIKGIYTTAQTLGLKLNTNLGVINIPISVWNYNNTHDKIKLELTVDGELGEYFVSKNDLRGEAGIRTFTFTNQDEHVQIYIDNVIFKGSEYDSLMLQNNSCSGTLKPGGMCSFMVNYEDVGQTYPDDAPLRELITINYRGGVYDKNYTNSTHAPYLHSHFNCKHLGVCDISFDNTMYNKHKIVIDDYGVSGSMESGIEITPSANDGCVDGLDISKQNHCSFDISATKPDARWMSKAEFSYRYYIDDKRIAQYKQISDDMISVSISNSLTVPSMDHEIPNFCLSQGGTDQYAEYLGRVSLGSYQDSYIIDSVDFTPSNTNYGDVYRGALVSKEEAIHKDGCTGNIVSKDKPCEMQIWAGCRGYGDTAGVLTFHYRDVNNPHQFEYRVDLPKISTPGLVVSAGYGSHMNEIWNEKMPVPTAPVHITIPHTDIAGFNVAIYNWRNQSTSFKVDTSSAKYLIYGYPFCLGNTGNTSFFWLTGTFGYCGISYDFSSLPYNTSIPTTFNVGLNNEIPIQVIWDITDGK